MTSRSIDRERDRGTVREAVLDHLRSSKPLSEWDAAVRAALLSMLNSELGLGKRHLSPLTGLEQSAPQMGVDAIDAKTPCLKVVR